MKKYLIFLVTCLSLVVLFQNCSSRHEALNSSSAVSNFSLQSVYPYQEAQAFFEDVQVVGKDESNGVWNYRFVASVVNVEDEDANIKVELVIMKDNGDLVCPRVKKTVNRGSNHIEISNCKLSEDLAYLKVEVRAALVGRSLESIRVHEFEF